MHNEKRCEYIHLGIFCVHTIETDLALHQIFRRVSKSVSMVLNSCLGSSSSSINPDKVQTDVSLRCMVGHR
jgi:hypothetical protein